MIGYCGNGSPFTQEDPTIKEFRDQFDVYAKEISVDGVLMDSHNIPTSVSIDCLNNDKTYTIVGLTVGMLGGCGCWRDIQIEIMEEE